MSKLETTNSRICQFYQNNPSIQFDAINLIFIDLFDKLQLDMQSTMSSVVHSQLLSNVNTNTQQIDALKTTIAALAESVTSIKSEISSNVILKFIELKNEYIADVQSIVNTNTYEKLGPLLDKNNNAMMDKTKLIMDEIIPKGNAQCYSQIHDTIKQFHKSISEDTNTLMKYVDNNSIKDYIQNFEMKSSVMFQTVQQPIYAFISASEERIHSSITNLKDSATISTQFQSKLFAELDDFLSKQREKSTATSSSTSNNNSRSDNHLNIVLNRIFHTAEIGTKPGSDFYTMKRTSKPKVLFYNKDDESNVTNDEVSAFIRDVDDQNCSGIYLSHKSGITSKPNYHIDAYRGHILVYVHHAEYSADKIKIAVDIIDTLSSKLKELNTNDHHDCTIPKDILDDINKEYQLFITQKDAIATVFKESQKKVLSQIDELKFPSLDKFLSTKYAVTVPKHGFKCDLCTCFTGNNLKALAAHKRGCIRKNVLIRTNANLGVHNKENMTVRSPLANLSTNTM